MSDDFEMDEGTLAAMNQSIIDKMITARVPGVPAKLAKYDYVCATDIRETVMTKLHDAQKALKMAELKETGIDDPEILKRVSALPKLTTEQKLQVAERWIEKQIAAAKKQGRLMTDQQISDWRLGVKLQVGSTCRFIGETRDETVKNEAGELVVVTREHGQIGHIAHIDEDHGGRILTFTPWYSAEKVATSDPSHDLIVDLIVREGTAGYLLLERVPQ